MRNVRKHLIALITTVIVASLCAPSRAQDLFDAPPAEAPDVLNAPPAEEPVVFAADSANLDGCQVIARIDNQIVLACEVLWRVNQLLEAHQAQAPEEVRIPPDKLQEARNQLMQREVAKLVDGKLIYNEFRRTVPADNLPRIEQSLLEPFEETEVPRLMKQLKVSNQRELEQELTRLGSSMADVRREFNEKVVASEWLRSKVKINEEISPEEMLDYYRAHLADYDYPTQARWEEIMVRKSRFAQPREAFAEMARLGNEIWQRGTQQQIQGPAFAEVAKAKSDGFTAKDGGIHDWTTKGALQAAAIDQALFTLQVGQMSPILETDQGFHIVRVLERKEAGRKAFTDVQIDIRQRLKEQRFRAEVDKYLAKLRQDARIWTVYTGNVSADALLGRRPDGTQQR